MKRSSECSCIHQPGLPKRPRPSGCLLAQVLPALEHCTAHIRRTRHQACQPAVYLLPALTHAHKTRNYNRRSRQGQPRRYRSPLEQTRAPSSRALTTRLHCVTKVRLLGHPFCQRQDPAAPRPPPLPVSLASSQLPHQSSTHSHVKLIGHLSATSFACTKHSALRY